MAMITFGVYATITSITLSSPANNNWTSDTTPDFTFTAVSDQNSTDILSELFINGTGYGQNASTLNNTATTITANTSLADGYYYWYINATDVNGTVESATRYIYIDTTAPTVTVTSNDNDNEIETMESITVTCSATDNLDTTPTYSVKLTYPDGSSETSTSASNTYSGSKTTQQGEYTVTCSATDNTDNTGTGTYTFKVYDSNRRSQMTQQTSTTTTTSDKSFIYFWIIVAIGVTAILLYSMKNKK